MAVSHVFSNEATDWTGTVTVHNSQGSTTTAAATGMVRPLDWNSVHNQFYTLSGNTNNASTVSGTNVVLQGLGNITLIGSTDTIGISAAPGTATMWNPYNEAVAVAAAALQNGSMWINPVPTPPTAIGGEVQIDRVVLPLAVTNNTNSTGSITISLWFGLYTKNASTLSLAYSTSRSTNWTFSGTVSSSLQQGIRLFTTPWTTTIQDGRYYVANIARSTSGGASAGISHYQQTQMASNFSGMFGVASNRSVQWPLGLGVYSTTTSSLPASIAFSQIDGTGSIAARPPIWWAVSGST